jgi:hypothetical protein
LPVGVPAAEVTVAVKVTGWPNVDGLTEEVSVVLDTAGVGVKAEVPLGVPRPVGPL